jgi:hypothetical protein
VRRSSGRLAVIGGARAGRLGIVLTVLCSLAMFPAEAPATNLFSIDPSAQSNGPIVTDAAGNGYLAWEHQSGSSSTPASTIFCKVPVGGSCTSAITLPLPPGTGSSEEPVEAYPVLGSQPGIVYVVAPRYVPSDVLIWTSENGGASFSAAKVVAGAGKLGVGGVLLNPLRLATKAKPTSDRFALALNNKGLGFGETGNEGAANLELDFAAPGGFATEPTLGFTNAGLPVEAYWNLETPVEVHYYVNKGGSTEEEKNWKGPELATDGYLPHLAGGHDGLFMLSEDYLSGESTENPPDVLEVRKFNEVSGHFEAPVVVARDPSAGLFETGTLFENPETGILYVAWPEVSGELYVMKLWESTDGGQTFHGERAIATIGSSYAGPPGLAVASDGQGWLTFKDAGGLEVADLNPLVFPSPPVAIAPLAPPAATATTTTQSGGGISGSSLTVPQGTAVSDQAHISGAAAANATGTVTYNLYKDSKCTVAAATGSVASVVKGVAGLSAAVKPGAGTYYWKALYSGDAANDPSTSACGSEVLVVALSAKNLGLPSSKVCLSRRKFVVHPRAPKGVKLVSVEVQINGKFVKKGKLNKHATSVSLVGLPKGTFKVALITTSSKGKVYEEVRTFHTCVPGKHKKK